MINERFSQTELQFGKGNIRINSGTYINESNNKVGIVAFMNETPREIGDEGDIKVSEEYNVEDFPIVMTFIKTESIDVIIEALLDTKKQMNKKTFCVECNNETTGDIVYNGLCASCEDDRIDNLDEED